MNKAKDVVLSNEIAKNEIVAREKSTYKLFCSKPSLDGRFSEVR